MVDDQRLIRDGIASLLSIQPGIEVVGTAVDGRDAVDRALATTPDVILMDVRMPVLDGVGAVTILRDRLPTTRIIMLTTFDDEEYVVRALTAGAAGYLLKDLPAPDLANAVRLAHAGVAQLDATIATRLAKSLTAPKSPRAPHTPPLTGRERDVLRLVAGGATNKEIAGHLYVSEGTVKNHISRILTRLNLRDRTQAAVYARDHGII
ncbi:DNA-binding response regulator, LuxR family [Actinokineospora spheciospongiae]|uniref:DNA-binding response regulator, LuxR family n=1 Tax=Actinokineospora spheciospongiae TaxID=909613 RepID=W7IN20_9PSEU|nr:DNA-binding response regulator, LuxR family [Actinokineospora spheciospongiae]